MEHAACGVRAGRPRRRSRGALRRYRTPAGRAAVCPTDFRRAARRMSCRGVPHRFPRLPAVRRCGYFARTPDTLRAACRHHGFVGRRDRPFVAGRQHRGRTESLRRDVRGGFDPHHEQGRRPDYADGERYRCESYGRCRVPAVDQVRTVVRLRNAQSLHLPHAHRSRVVGAVTGLGIRPRIAALGSVGRVVRAGHQLRPHARRRQGANPRALSSGRTPVPSALRAMASRSTH